MMRKIEDGYYSRGPTPLMGAALLVASIAIFAGVELAAQAPSDLTVGADAPLQRVEWVSDCATIPVVSDDGQTVRMFALGDPSGCTVTGGLVDMPESAVLSNADPFEAAWPADYDWAVWHASVAPSGCCLQRVLVGHRGEIR